MGTVVMYGSSVDGLIANENDQPGPLFDWLSSGDVPLDQSKIGPAAAFAQGTVAILERPVLI